MRSQITLGTSGSRGFLIIEVMLAFSLIVLFALALTSLSLSMLSLHSQAESELQKIKATASDIETSSTTKISLYGTYTKSLFLDPIKILHSNYGDSWGRDNCFPRISMNLNQGNVAQAFHTSGISLAGGNVSTDIEARNGIVYLTADSSVSSASDFYIFDARASPAQIVSSINTGPGLSALTVAGPYVFAASKSAINQLQVIDISNRQSPVLTVKIKLPPPLASSTMPFATSIYYDKGRIYLGTEKWDGNEFSVFDVSNPAAPNYIGGYKVGSIVEDIFVNDGFAYIATPEINQMRVLNVADPSSISLVGTFTASGWQTQEGKTLSFFEDRLALGRTVGGFNVATNHEIFMFSTSSPLSKEFSHDIAGGVYGILLRPPYVYLATHSLGHEFQIWDTNLSNKVVDFSLGFNPASISCDVRTIYFSTGNSNGFSYIKL